jgi:glycosyltransferase involved in cell wall biosynthesis
MQAGLPVLAKINPGNDLVEIIIKSNVGRVSVGKDKDILGQLACELLDLLETDQNIKHRCRNLYFQNFSPEVAVKQLTYALQEKSADCSSLFN